MQIKKAIISFLLLITYSLSFALSLAPRCQEVVCVDLSSESVKEKQHNHNHHQHSKTDKAENEHQHFVHADHYDEGFYDFVVCLISEIKHPAHDCNVQNYLPSKTYTLSSKSFNKHKSLAVLLAVVLQLKSDITSIVLNHSIPFTYTSLSRESSPHRGPPSLFC